VQTLIGGDALHQIETINLLQMTGTFVESGLVRC
jgi:hypothetical protein